jgi:menaquinone-9 beta-reductase
VIVVGGGPAGAASAFHLARAGVDVLVLDRARFPRDKPCGEYLSPQASRLLHDMGALDAIERSGAAHLAGMRVRAPNGVEIHGEFAAAHGFQGFRDRGLALRRLILDAILLERARVAGARVTESSPVREVCRDANGRVIGVEARDASGAWRTYRAPLVVGADGLRSVIARRTRLGRHGRWPRRVALVTHCRGVDGMGDCGEMHVTADGYVGLANVGQELTNVALVVSSRRAPEMAGDAAGFLQRALAGFPLVAARLTNAEQVTVVRAVGEFNWRAPRAWAGGVALVGDAADFFDPFTGEGIYTALRGGEMIAPYAAAALRAKSAREMDFALHEYDRARRKEFGGKWLVERTVGMAVAFPFLINRAARALASRKDMADLLVGVTGDFVPAAEVLRAGYVWRLLTAGIGTRDLGTRHSAPGDLEPGVDRNGKSSRVADQRPVE